MKQGAGKMSNAVTINMFDEILTGNVYSTVVVKERLQPAGGFGHHVAAAQYPSSTSTSPDSFRGGANIIPCGDGTMAVIIDSIASAANRRDDVIFKDGNERMSSLFPAVNFEIPGEGCFHIAQAPHRSACASIRLNAEVEKILDEAMEQMKRGNLAPLARFDPSSIIGGVWDSRKFHLKMTRIVRSETVGFGATTEQQMNVFGGSAAAKVIGHDLIESKQAASSGHGRVPNVDLPTNKVRVTSIESTSTVSIDPIRELRSRPKSTGPGRPRTAEEKEEDLKLQRYILGLCLLKALVTTPSHLRSGCDLIQTDDPDAFTVTLACRNQKDRKTGQDIVERVAGLDLEQVIEFCNLAKGRGQFEVMDFKKPFIVKKESVIEDSARSGKAKDKKKVAKSEIVAETEGAQPGVEG